MSRDLPEETHCHPATGQRCRLTLQQHRILTSHRARARTTPQLRGPMPSLKATTLLRHRLRRNSSGRNQPPSYAAGSCQPATSLLQRSPQVLSLCPQPPEASRPRRSPTELGGLLINRASLPSHRTPVHQAAPADPRPPPCPGPAEVAPPAAPPHLRPAKAPKARRLRRVRRPPSPNHPAAQQVPSPQARRHRFSLRLLR